VAYSDRKTKGLKGNKLYGVYHAMKQRCYNPKHISNRWYSEMGIGVCDLWLDDPMSFINWANAHGYQEGLVLDRIDNNKGYAPDNCRWVTPLVSTQNRKRTLRVYVKGTGLTLTEACDMFDINYDRVLEVASLRDLSVQEAFEMCYGKRRLG
jgi:hypothetical protein